MIRSYLTKPFVFLFITTVFVLTSFSGEVEAGRRYNKGVHHLLNDILTELQYMDCYPSKRDCCSTINGATQAGGLITDPVQDTHELVNVTGPGTFVAARMVKQGGSTGLTAVELIIDGETVIHRNIAALKNWGMTQNNPFGVVVFTNSSIDTVTIGFSQPISFEEDLILNAVVGETGVVQIIGTVIYGE